MSGSDPDAGGGAEPVTDGPDESAPESLTDRAADVADSDVSEWLSLEPGEEVVWAGEPTKQKMIGTVVTGVVLIPLFGMGLLILLFAPLTYLGIKHTDYVVTTRSLYVKQGILSTNIESVDLDRIQNTEFTQSFWGKQLGYGTIDISTAGSAGADISFDDVEDARAVREQISKVQREFGGRGGTDGTGGERAGDTGGPATADQLAELVAELRATREAMERVEAKLSDDGGARPLDSTDSSADEPDSVGFPERTDEGPEADGTNDGSDGSDRTSDD